MILRAGSSRQFGALNTGLRTKTISLQLGRIHPLPLNLRSVIWCLGLKSEFCFAPRHGSQARGWVRSWPNMIGFAPITSTGCQAKPFTNNGTTFDTVSCHRNGKNGCHECVSKRWMSHTGWSTEKCHFQAVLSRVSWLGGATKGWKVSKSDVVHPTNPTNQPNQPNPSPTKLT